MEEPEALSQHAELLELLASAAPDQRAQGRERLAGLGLAWAEQDALRREATRRRVEAGVAWAREGRSEGAPRELVALASPELRAQARRALEALLAAPEAAQSEPFRVVEVPGEDVLEIGRWDSYEGDDWSLAFAPFTVQHEPGQTGITAEDPRWMPVLEELLDALWRPEPAAPGDPGEPAEEPAGFEQFRATWRWGDPWPPPDRDAAAQVRLRLDREEREWQSENPGQISLFAPLFLLSDEERGSA